MVTSLWDSYTYLRPCIDGSQFLVQGYGLSPDEEFLLITGGIIKKANDMVL